MMMVQRWNTISNGHLVESEIGAIVHYNDYAALESQLAAAEKARDGFQKALTFRARQFCKGEPACTETEMCITEYCLPCYAKAHLRAAESKADDAE